MPDIKDILPGEPLKEPPIPHAIHNFLQRHRFETEENFTKFVAERVAGKECTPEFHNEVSKIKHYFRIVNPETAIKRIDKILKEL